MSTWIYSKNVLVDGRFQPATVEINHDGKFVHVWKGRAPVSVLDYGECYVGPGLIDIGVHELSETSLAFEQRALQAQAFTGGVTSVVHVPVNINPKFSNLNFFKFASCCEETTISSSGLGYLTSYGIPSSRFPYLLLDDSTVASPVFVLSADNYSPLASPFRTRPHIERRIAQGVRWRLGRSRKPSNGGEELTEEEAAEDGVTVPKPMLEVLLKREEETYKSTPSASTAPLSEKPLARSRPPPIQTNITTDDALLPKNFLQDYRVFLSLKPVEQELAAIRFAKGVNARGILRVASSEVLREVPVGDALVLGTTISHLLFGVTDIKLGEVCMKLEPPIRLNSPLQLIERCLEDPNFVISSGHENHPDFACQDFERAYSNHNKSISHCLSSLCTISKGDDEIFAKLWEGFSAAPAKLIGLRSKGTISEGKDADLVVFQVREGTSTFRNIQLTGKVVHVFVNGRTVL